MPGMDKNFIQWTILIICMSMIGGGLLVFYLRLRDAKQKWRMEYNQVIGTIFFFPTLILLAVYLQMSRDAVIGILGAFLGSLFTRGISPLSPSQGTPSPLGLTPAPKSNTPKTNDDGNSEPPNNSTGEEFSVTLKDELSTMKEVQPETVAEAHERVKKEMREAMMQKIYGVPAETAE